MRKKGLFYGILVSALSYCTKINDARKLMRLRYFVNLFGKFFEPESNVLSDLFKEKRESWLVIFQLELRIVFRNIYYGKVCTAITKCQCYPPINQNWVENMVIVYHNTFFRL